MPTNATDAIDSVDRRRVLGQLLSVGAWAAAAGLTLAEFPSLLFAAGQSEWRMCGKCNMMFYAGYRRSHCPAGARHAAREGANFMLPHDVRETSNAQGAWRFCSKCESLFFDGYPAKGVCPAGGGHVAQGFVFVLPHDVAERGYSERDWRFCQKCYSIFYNHTASKGRCAAGGAHVAQGFNFVLRFHGNLEGDVQLNPVRE